MIQDPSQHTLPIRPLRRVPHVCHAQRAARSAQLSRRGAIAALTAAAQLAGTSGIRSRNRRRLQQNPQAEGGCECDSARFGARSSPKLDAGNILAAHAEFFIAVRDVEARHVIFEHPSSSRQWLPFLTGVLDGFRIVADRVSVAPDQRRVTLRRTRRAWTGRLPAGGHRRPADRGVDASYQRRAVPGARQSCTQEAQESRVGGPDN
jgi:hypothetical protein